MDTPSLSVWGPWCGHGWLWSEVSLHVPFALFLIERCPWVEQTDLSSEEQSLVLPQTGLGGAVGNLAWY